MKIWFLFGDENGVCERHVTACVVSNLFAPNIVPNFVLQFFLIIHILLYCMLALMHKINPSNITDMI